MEKIYKKSWAKRNGINTDYNFIVTKGRADLRVADPDSLPVAYCPVCEQAFETKKHNGKANKNNRLLKPKYLPKYFGITLGLRKELCGVDKCYNNETN